MMEILTGGVIVTTISSLTTFLISIERNKQARKLLENHKDEYEKLYNYMEELIEYLNELEMLEKEVGETFYKKGRILASANIKRRRKIISIILKNIEETEKVLSLILKKLLNKEDKENQNFSDIIEQLYKTLFYLNELYKLFIKVI